MSTTFRNKSCRAEIWPISARFDAVAVLVCCHVTTEDALRKRIGRLVKLGVTQKAIAARMGLSEPWLSRWLRRSEPGRLTVAAMDAFHRFCDELAVAARDIDGRPMTSRDLHDARDVIQLWEQLTDEGQSVAAENLAGLLRAHRRAPSTGQTETPADTTRATSHK
jgi:transcriptional regulator with XRE-family HTH domain